jgi:hypothetical protein
MVILCQPNCTRFRLSGGECDCIPTLGQGPLLPDSSFRSPAPRSALVPDLEAATLVREMTPIVESRGASAVSSGFVPDAVDPECLYMREAAAAVLAQECY